MREKGGQALIAWFFSLLGSFTLTGFAQFFATIIGIVASVAAVRYYTAAREASIVNTQLARAKLKQIMGD